MSHFKKSFALVLAVIMMFALAACGGGSDSSSGDKGSGDGSSSGGEGIQEMTIKISHVVAENTPKNKGAEAMAKYIEEHSDGKIKVQVYPNSSLFGDKDEVENLIANNVQFIIPDLSKMVGKNPAFNVPSLPFLFANNEEAYKFWDGEKGQEVLHSLEDQGIIGLKMWPNGPKQLTNSKHPVTKPDDLKGMKLRVQGGQVLAAIFENLGAGATTIPFSELYTALQQGTVDGEVNTFSNIDTKKLDDVQKYMTTNWGAARVDYALFTNTKFWSSLNDATKEVIQGGIDEGTKVARSSAEELNAQGLKNLQERGKIEIHELTDEERQAFQDALQPIYEQFADEIGQDVIDAAKAAAGK
ncbi:MAG TPA: DctP family TRAP transporter solute-binding subunit [Bacillales bacterium]|nr:DctP family TRAP transporter solute-binding subunit [Bacillales bacterium]